MSGWDSHDSLIEKFDQFDADGKGYLDSNDLKEMLSSFLCTDVSLEQVKMLQDEFDTNSSGNIDVSQFIIMMVSRGNFLRL